MIKTNSIRLDKFSFRYVFIVEDRNRWTLVSDSYSPENDLVLCLDFGLKLELEKLKGTVEYLDHLLMPDICATLNEQMHYFLQNWYKDEHGDDFFQYKCYDLGDALLLNVLNDVTYFSHFFFKFLALRSLQFEKVILTVNEGLVSIFKQSLIPFESVDGSCEKIKAIYTFPMSKWMQESLSRKSFAFTIRKVLLHGVDIMHGLVDGIFFRKEKSIYIQSYYSTEPIVQHFLNTKGIRVILNDYTSWKRLWRERRVPTSYSLQSADQETERLIKRFQNSDRTEWTFEGHDVSEMLFERIIPILRSELSKAIVKAEANYRFFQNRKITLMVPITNLWLENRLTMQYCFNNDIPVFMILNGLMSLSFWREGHDSDWVNCFSESIKNEYFKGASNAVALGDPRMDAYANLCPKSIDRDNACIVIGTSGFNLIDLNSYSAIEFSFLYDILVVLRKHHESGRLTDIIVKVRANGYTSLYKDFIEEFFPDLEIRLLQKESFSSVIRSADLYITMYSQTLFEASCLGIPAIYYKNDTQEFLSPFNCEGELVTAKNRSELVEAINGFFNNDEIFHAFLDKSAMEKYVGPLDGQNLNRNINFIERLLQN